MTETFGKYGLYEVDHTKFGGIICPSDFNTDNRCKTNTNGSSTANRIVRDWTFDMQCKINRENILKQKRGK